MSIENNQPNSNKGVTEKKSDPVAPGSSKSRKHMNDFFRGAVNGLFSQHESNINVDPNFINSIAPKQTAQKKPSRYAKSTAFLSSVMSKMGLENIGDVRVRRINKTEINTGDPDVDDAVSDALNDTADVLNVFQDSVNQAFQINNRRMSHLEGDVQRIDHRLKGVERSAQDITKQLEDLRKPQVGARTLTPKDVRASLLAHNKKNLNENDSGSDSSFDNPFGKKKRSALGSKLKKFGKAAIGALAPYTGIAGVAAGTYAMRDTDEGKKNLYEKDVQEYGKDKAEALKKVRSAGITGKLNDALDNLLQGKNPFHTTLKKKDEQKSDKPKTDTELSEQLEFKTRGTIDLESDKDMTITSRTKITIKAPQVVIDGVLMVKKQPTAVRGVQSSSRDGADEIMGKSDDQRVDNGLPQSSQDLGGDIDAPVSKPSIAAPKNYSQTATSAPTEPSTDNDNFIMTKGYHPGKSHSLETSDPMGKMPNFKTPSGADLKGDDLRRGVYQAFRKQKYSHQGALVMAGEVARENNFNPNLVFGNHRDPANGAKNSGMFSWQGSRNPRLMKYLADHGALDKNGNIIRNQNALDAQAAFVKYELDQKQYGGGKYNEMLSQEHVDRNAAADAIGKNYIRWAINNPKYRAAGIRNRTRGYDDTARAVASMKHADAKVASLDPTSGVEVSKPKNAYNSLTAKANFMQPDQFGAPGTNIVTVKTKGGHKFRINAASAESFKRTIEDLEDAGMPLGSIGGYNPRPGGIGGRGKMSQHAMGNAMDIGSQSARDVISKASRAWIMQHPKQWREILDRNGMISGGDWKNPDLGHLEWSGRKPWLENPELYEAGKKQMTDPSMEIKRTRLMPPIQELDDAPLRGDRTPNYSKNIEDRRANDTSLKNAWWKFWKPENVKTQKDYKWADKIHPFDSFKMEKARQAIGLGGSDADMAHAVEAGKGKITESERLGMLNTIKKEDGQWTPDQSKEAHNLAKNIYAEPEDSLKDLKSSFQKAQDIQDARVVDSIPKPDLSLGQRSGEEITADVKNDKTSEERTQITSSHEHTRHTHMRVPRNDAEAMGPTPGSDGYGSMRQDPDGFCALCTT